MPVRLQTCLAVVEALSLTAALALEGGALVPLVERSFVTVPSGSSLGTTPTFAPFTSVGIAYAL